MARIYIAGPMSGYENHNFPVFWEAAALLRSRGFNVISPAEINPDASMEWGDCMRADIAALVTCDAVQLLPGWEKSEGATLEHHIAERLLMEIRMPEMLV